MENGATIKTRSGKRRLAKGGQGETYKHYAKWNINVNYESRVHESWERSKNTRIHAATIWHPATPAPCEEILCLIQLILVYANGKENKRNQFNFSFFYNILHLIFLNYTDRVK